MQSKHEKFIVTLQFRPRHGDGKALLAVQLCRQLPYKDFIRFIGEECRDRDFAGVDHIRVFANLAGSFQVTEESYPGYLLQLATNKSLQSLVVEEQRPYEFDPAFRECIKDSEHKEEGQIVSEQLNEMTEKDDLNTRQKCWEKMKEVSWNMDLSEWLERNKGELQSHIKSQKIVDESKFEGKKFFDSEREAVKYLSFLGIEEKVEAKESPGRTLRQTVEIISDFIQRMVDMRQ